MTENISRRRILTIAGGAAITGTAGIAALNASRNAGAQTDGTPAMSGSPMAEGSPMVMGGAGAAYMVIANGGAADDRLIGGSSEVAQVVEIHNMEQQGDVMVMTPLPDGLVIPAGGTVALEPGGYHVMLLGLTQDLKPSETYSLTLQFETAGEIELFVPIFPTEDAFEEIEEIAPSEAVTVGDLSITRVWTRMAPMLSDASPVASPEGTPGM